MNEGLLYPIRHNSWATERLLEFLAELPPEQMTKEAEGTYGSILDTMRHLVGAEGRYRGRLAGQVPEWNDRLEKVEGVAELLPMTRDNAAFWEDFLSQPFDPARVIHGTDSDGRTFDVDAGMLVAQSLNHGNEHRSQVFTILTILGVEPPDLDGWSWGEATGAFSFTS
jgi:uncharacterized damage-inducible protein DinB